VLGLLYELSVEINDEGVHLDWSRGRIRKGGGSERHATSARHAALLHARSSPFCPALPRMHSRREVMYFCITSPLGRRNASSFAYSVGQRFGDA
jgi:hypothetical protein